MFADNERDSSDKSRAHSDNDDNANRGSDTPPKQHAYQDDDMRSDGALGNAPSRKLHVGTACQNSYRDSCAKPSPEDKCQGRDSGNAPADTQCVRTSDHTDCSVAALSAHHGDSARDEDGDTGSVRTRGDDKSDSDGDKVDSATPFLAHNLAWARVGNGPLSTRDDDTVPRGKAWSQKQVGSLEDTLHC